VLFKRCLFIFIGVCFLIMPFMAEAAKKEREARQNGIFVLNAPGYPACENDCRGVYVAPPAGTHSGEGSKTQLNVTSINQNSLKYTWRENGYAIAAGCVPASFAMLIDYEVRRKGYKKIEYDKVMRQLRQQYEAHNKIPKTAGNGSSNFTSKIRSYLKPIPTSVDMTDKNFDMVLEKLDLGNGYSAAIRLKAYSKLNNVNRFLGVVKENLDSQKPVAVQTSALDKKYVELPVGNKIKLKLDRDPGGNKFPWTGGHEMVIMGYETSEKCTDNAYGICRLILNDTNSSSPQSFDVYKTSWKNQDMGVALWFRGEGGMNQYVYIIMGTDLDLIAISGLELM